ILYHGASAPQAPALSLHDALPIFNRTVPRTLVSYIQFQSSMEGSTNGSSPFAPPALLTSKSTRGSRAASASTDSWLVTSNSTAGPPISPANASSLSLRRASTTTCQPSFANKRALAAPIPDDAPVTTATF